jgi:hypothetical protein
MSAHAETASFGGKTIKIIVGMPPGGGVDSYARLAQRHLGRFLPGSPGIVVQNMPGAGSLRSVMALVNSLEDVVGTFSSSLLTEAISMPERVKIDFRSFASIGNVSEDIRVCYTRSALGVRSWSDLLVRGQVVFGATAPGTSGNVDTAMLRNLFGVRLKQVQGYAGSADKRLALEKGEIDGDCGGWTSIPEDWVRSSKINVVLRLSPMLVAGMDRDVPFGGDLLVNDHDRKVYDSRPRRNDPAGSSSCRGVAPDRSRHWHGLRCHGRRCRLPCRGAKVRAHGHANDRQRGGSRDRRALRDSGRYPGAGPEHCRRVARAALYSTTLIVIERPGSVAHSRPAWRAFSR